MFCDTGDGRGGYTYHELYTCKPCLERVGLDVMDGIAKKIGQRDRHGQLPSAYERQRIFNAAVRKYGI